MSLQYTTKIWDEKIRSMNAESEKMIQTATQKICYYFLIAGAVLAIIDLLKVGGR